MPRDSVPRSTRRPHPADGRSGREVVTPSLWPGRARPHGGAPSVARAARQVGTPLRHNLPPQARSIVGREQDLALARQRLSRADVRLLTLTGPPGVGKTRLAVELAAAVLDEFEHGAWFVDLAPIGDPRLVADATTRALGLRDVGRRPPADVLEEFLRGRSLLLILDNFEQVLDAADLVGRLLAACPRLKVVVTSRAPLHLRWESELPVPPLALPDLDSRPAAEALTASPAVQLFVERAQAVVPNLVLGDSEAAAVAETCIHLDGLPLAIELAAARIKLFPPVALLRRLVGAGLAPPASGVGQAPPLHLLSGGAHDLPERQRTLRGAIAWSYDLLDPDEQVVFRRLTVFVGGASLDAVEAVMGDGCRVSAEDETNPHPPTPDARHPSPEVVDLVGSLVDKSLVRRDEQPDGEPRLRMLETLRDYAWEQLEASGELETTRERHASYYLDLAEQAEIELSGPHQQTWLARLEGERDNLRAVEHRAAARGDSETIVRLGAALWPFWLARGDAADARARLETILPLVRRVPPAPAVARALHGAGLLAEKLGEYATCRSLLEEGIAVARQVEDRRTLASVLDSLGRQEFIEGRYAASRPRLEESLAILRDLDDRRALARVLSHLGFLDYLEGRLESARAIFKEGLALARQTEDRHRVAEFLDNLGNTFRVEGDFDSAAHRFQEAVAIWREIGQGHWLAMALNNLGSVQTLRGEFPAARAQLREALGLSRRIGNRRRLVLTLAAVATLAAAEGQAERAVRLDAAASAAADEIGAMLAQPAYKMSVPHVERARRKLGPRAAAAAAMAGRAMTLEQGVDETLAWLGEPEGPTELGGVGLSRREREVAALVARGLTNHQIAEALVVTEGTAANYVQRVLTKLDFNTRAQIAAWAVEHGLSPSPRCG